ncbi:DDE family transposase [Chryseobacterium sp. 7]|uniref:IS982 family transposase n=1 Tax=Chryseobacterium sp. 7 TaxID=2035214 RepID=UPI000EB024F1|nr:IS982 family transposase [Chryseobacterium sp. 7]RLJ23607.1 DDE family transposase [Chryseobacterium sp. 7]RLJ31519.1 DDE family transposase [Chryseobacterium sp. 7]RLJ31821.1 DDE family transposase [Chryseobacterium sp. 7]RLJ32750.1 DDE family transposase [Chryseobacterium sp. 7]
MNNLDAIYNFILNELKKLISDENFYFKPIKPKLSDLEIVALNISAEYLSIDSEYQLFRHLSNSKLNGMIERSVYNRRKRKLFLHLERIRKLIVVRFNEIENVFIIDSMPLEICRNARAKRSKICKESEFSFPSRGYCASQSSYYYGYKLHAICSVSGVFQSFDISTASIHDIHFLQDIKHQINDCTLIGDRGYLSAQVQSDLFNYANIKLDTPMRINQKNYQKQKYIFRKSRKRIETLFSQLCDQFKIRSNYAKSFNGFKTRILSKITALTFIQFVNVFVFNRKMNNIKIALV